MNIRSPNLIKTVLALSLIAATAGASAQIYRWKDENGRTVFSDKPPEGRARQQEKLDAPLSSSAGSTAQKNLAEQEISFQKRQKDARERAEKTGKDEAAQAEKQEYCTSLRRQLMALESGERIVRRDENGERQFLDDAQREQEIAKVRQSLQNTCQ
ncbi:DUF4124 domain-containing protein [Propionivibrio dicarboxylicus]|uniref:DUF4124 domain-containing protein n=1 Tax=Propionivibrio dicarboxylicus TaxID=83767 RepID=A0A1G8D8V4_9RHOO|nr:DUF4124 domain-containing protein [Propionivibrio dicarboxylicus]SDH54092.1 protein of unknown function [Propionivibrio dicarboxylicus]